MASYYDQYYNRQRTSQALDSVLSNDPTQPLRDYNSPNLGKSNVQQVPYTGSAPYTSAGATAPKTGGQWKEGYGNVAGAASAATSGFVQGQEGVDNFSIDPFAGYVGSGKGFMSGGTIGAIAGGVAAQVGQFSKINRNLKNLDTSVDLAGMSATGAPVYQGDAYAQAQGNINALQDGQDALNKKGWYDPANLVFSGIFGTKRKIKEAKDKINEGIARAQEDYNKADQNYDQAQIRQQDYNKRRNNTARLYNLYSIPT